MIPKIRAATNADARDIEHILAEAGQIPKGLDWSEIEPNWLVEEYNGVIVGCVQVLAGKPLGHIGFLAVLPGYQNSRHGFGYALWQAAEKVLSNSGCDGYTAMTVNPAVIKRFQRLGAVMFGEPCRLFFKRVYRKKKEQRLWAAADRPSQLQ